MRPEVGSHVGVVFDDEDDCRGVVGAVGGHAVVEEPRYFCQVGQHRLGCGFVGLRAGGRLVSVCGLQERQRHGEGRPQSQGALGLDAPAMEFDELPDQGQADAGALARPRRRRIDLVEAVEEIGQVILGDADAGVAHGEQGLPGVVFAHGHDNRAAGGGELEGVREQVEDDGFQLLGVEDVGERRGLRDKVKGEVARSGQRLERGQALAEEGYEVVVVGLERERAGVKFGEVEELVDQAEEPVAVAAGAFEVRAGLVERGEAVLEDVVERAEGERQRRAELMGDVGQETRLEFVGPA